MSGNQSKSDRNNNEYKRSGRPNNPNSPRNFPGGGGRGGGGGGSAVPPSSGYYSAKSYKKVVSNNAASQGVQTSRVAASGVNPNANVNVNTGGGRGAAGPNGAHAQTSLRGATVKSTDASVQKSTPGLPKAPQSNAVPPTSVSSGTTGPATPVKGSADASKAFSLQFGSISPGVVNGMQLPARTSSAPPNMDEQKRAQALFGSIKATSSPNPPVPKQHIPRKDIGSVDQHNAGEARPTPKEKKDVLPTPPPVAAHTQKPTGPPMPSIPMPYHQPQIHIPFGSPNQQLQSQGMSNTALPVPLPMHITVGNPQVPQQVYVPGIQHHQGIIHQSQGLTFSSPMGSQLGNMVMGMGVGPQYQQPMANFGGARRTVKITHPDTHEELRLDKRADGFVNGGQSGSRPRPQGQPQSQVVPPFSQPHQMNYYPNSYNANSHYFQQPASNPLTSTQTTPGTQGPRFYNQASKQVTVKPMVRSQGEKVGDSSPAMVKIEIPKSQKTGEDTTQKDLETVVGISTPAVVKESPSLENSDAEAAKKATVSSGSFKEEQKQPAEMAPPISVDKIDGQASAVSNPSVEPHGSMGSEPQEIPKSSTLSSGTNKDVLETSNKVVPSTAVDVSASGFNNKEEVLSSTEVINSGLEEQVKEPVNQNKDSTVPDVTTVQQKDSSENIDDKSSGLISDADLDVLSAETSSLTLGSSQSDDKSRLISNADLDVLSAETSSLTLGSSQSDDKSDDKDVNQDNSKEPVTSAEEPHAVSVSVPETTPLTLEMEATGPISPSASGKIKGSIAAKPKKKIKDILKNADARGTTSDISLN